MDLSLFFNKLYTYFDRNTNTLFERFCLLTIRTISNIFLNIYYSCSETPSLKHKHNTNVSVVVSLTSFPKRLSKLWIVIESLIRQSLKPNIIVLYLSKDQVPNIDALPQKLLRLQARGLIIKLVDGDLRSHKKYYYTYKDFPKSKIILADDDIIYPSNMIDEILKCFTKFIQRDSLFCINRSLLAYMKSSLVIPNKERCSDSEKRPIGKIQISLHIIRVRNKVTSDPFGFC